MFPLNFSLIADTMSCYEERVEEGNLLIGEQWKEGLEGTP